MDDTICTLKHKCIRSNRICGAQETAEDLVSLRVVADGTISYQTCVFGYHLAKKAHCYGLIYSSFFPRLSPYDLTPWKKEVWVKKNSSRMLRFNSMLSKSQLLMDGQLKTLNYFRIILAYSMPCQERKSHIMEAKRS